jgi:hypothetical protein
VHPQPGVGEHLHHERVLTQCLRDEGADPLAAGQRDQVLEQQRADTAAVHVIGDSHGDLRRSGAVAGHLVAAAADHLALQYRQQRAVVWRRLAAYPARLAFGRAPAHAEEAQIQIFRGHLGVHVPHGIEIVRPCGPDFDRGPVGEQRVGIGPSLCIHVAPALPLAQDAAPYRIVRYLKLSATEEPT